MSSIKEPRVILVTGANKGIGFLVVKKLAEDSLSANNNIILLGSRDLNRGEDAYKQLNSPSNVHVLQLDTSSYQSIIHAINEIKEKYGGQIDIVINNAALSTTEITKDSARELFNTNYYGIHILNENILPLMRQNGRIINVSSRVASNVLQEASQTIQDKYTLSTLTKNQLDQLVENFISAIPTNTLEQEGYNPKADYLVYGVTKAALNTLTQIEAREWSNRNNLLVVSVTPGLCATDMARHIPNARSPEFGADSILYVVNTPQCDLVNGGFYRDGQLLPLIPSSTITTY